jgi:acetolactate synthase I/II/III large subunit
LRLCHGHGVSQRDRKDRVASVTCGPGIAQISTALATAVRANIPLVVFAGESPINAKFYNQAIDQGPIVHATGAHYVRAHSTTRMLDHVREAFYVARYERWPVVLGVPYDLQKLPFSGAPNYVPSCAFIPQTGHTPPQSTIHRPLGREARSRAAADHHRGPGAVSSGAHAAIEELAETSGALLATTLCRRAACSITIALQRRRGHLRIREHKPQRLGRGRGARLRIPAKLERVRRIPV